MQKMSDPVSADVEVQSLVVDEVRALIADALAAELGGVLVATCVAERLRVRLVELRIRFVLDAQQESAKTEMASAEVARSTLAEGDLRVARSQVVLATGERQFADGDRPEWCAVCGRHIGHHFGGAEYRCDPRIDVASPPLAVDSTLCRQLAAECQAYDATAVDDVSLNLPAIVAQLVAAADLGERLVVAERERDEALENGVLSQRVCDIENDRAQLRLDLEALRGRLAATVGDPSPARVVAPRGSSPAAPSIGDAGERMRQVVREVVRVTLPGHGGWCYGSEHPETHAAGDRVALRVAEKLAGWVSPPLADPLRTVVLRVAGDVLDDPETKVVRSFDTAVAIADRVTAELAGRSVTGVDLPGRDSSGQSALRVVVRAVVADEFARWEERRLSDGGATVDSMLDAVADRVVEVAGARSASVSDEPWVRSVIADAVRAEWRSRGWGAEGSVVGAAVDEAAAGIAARAASHLVRRVVVSPMAGNGSVARAIEVAARHELRRFLPADQYARVCAELGRSAAFQLSLEHGCPVHAGVVHGGEAEELRSAVEAALAEATDGVVLASDLRDLLDSVDARDSVARLDRGPGEASEERRRCTEQLAAAMGLHVLGRTYESLLENVTLNLRDTGLMLRVSQALGEVAQEVGVPLSEESPARVVSAVRERIAGLRRELEQLGRETTMAQLVTGLLVATDPASTGGVRERVRRDLLAWASRGAQTSGAVRDALLASSVDELDLSVRASNFLLGIEVRVVGDLVRRTEQDLRRRGASAKMLREYSEELAKLGLSLAPPPAASLPSASAKSTRSRRRAAPGGASRG